MKKTNVGIDVAEILADAPVEETPVETSTEVPVNEEVYVKPEGYVVIDGAVVPDPSIGGVNSKYQ